MMAEFETRMITVGDLIDRLQLHPRDAIIRCYISDGSEQAELTVQTGEHTFVDLLAEEMIPGEQTEYLTGRDDLAMVIARISSGYVNAHPEDPDFMTADLLISAVNEKYGEMVDLAEQKQEGATRG